MLEKAYEELPSESSKTTRFKIPDVKRVVQGNKTIVKNFGKICSVINRDAKKVFKFFLSSLATAGELKKKGVAEFVGKFSTRRLQSLMNRFLKEFVYCQECGKPETKLVREDRINFIKCGVCGAKYPVKSIK